MRGTCVFRCFSHDRRATRVNVRFPTVADARLWSAPPYARIQAQKRYLRDRTFEHHSGKLGPEQKTISEEDHQMKSSSVLLAAVLSVASLAHANTIVMGPQVFGPSPTDWITTFVFNQFDPSMGTLTGVTTTETLTNSDGGTVTNGGTQTATFTVTETIDGFLIVPDGGGT